MKGLFYIFNFWLFSSLLIQHNKLWKQERVRVEHSQGFVADTSSWNLGLLGQFSLFILKSNTFAFQRILEICQRKCSLVKCFINTAVRSQHRQLQEKKNAWHRLVEKAESGSTFDMTHVIWTYKEAHISGGVLLFEIIEMEDKLCIINYNYCSVFWHHICLQTHIYFVFSHTYSSKSTPTLGQSQTVTEINQRIGQMEFWPDDD